MKRRSKQSQNNIMSSSSRRSLLAALWSIVGLLTLSSFVVALVFAYANTQYNDNNEYNYYDERYWGNSNDQQQQQYQQQAISVTSRAMVFAAIWTAVLSGILVIYGTVILGVRMPTGKYYACCAGNVHRMTPTSLGAFGGSLLMFANLTLVCAILFGEFEIRDFNYGNASPEDENNNNDDDESNWIDQSSYAFSIMCIFFTVMYAAFAALIFYNSNVLLEESVVDWRDESSSLDPYNSTEMNHAPGYIGGDRFGVGVGVDVNRSYGHRGTTPTEAM